MALSSLTVKIHPVVLFGIVDSYERRNEDVKRVIGTLLGTFEKGAVEVTNYFCVPHNEWEDEVAIDLEFAKNIYELHKKVNPSELIVGWYATGNAITEHSVLIHDYYLREANNSPIHVTVDTLVQNKNVAIKAYISSGMGVAGKAIGKMFTPLPVQIVGYEPELVGVKVCQQGKHHPKRIIDFKSDLEQIKYGTASMLEMLDSVLKYVDDVLGGKIPANSSIGRSLMTMVKSVPKLENNVFKEMLNSNIKDLLMLVYLAQLTKTQLSLNNKLALL